MSIEMPKRFVDSALPVLLCFAFLISLISQLIVPARAETHPQVTHLYPGKKILLLYTYGVGIPAYRKASPAFLSVVTADGVSLDDIFIEYLDLQRNRGSGMKCLEKR
jgi:hypothetical protein